MKDGDGEENGGDGNGRTRARFVNRDTEHVEASHHVEIAAASAAVAVIHTKAALFGWMYKRRESSRCQQQSYDVTKVYLWLFRIRFPASRTCLAL